MSRRRLRKRRKEMRRGIRLIDFKKEEAEN